MSSQQTATAQQRDDVRLERAMRYRKALEKLLADGTTYAELDVRDLATEADSSRSSFYVYFEDKVDFLCTLAEPVFAHSLSIAADFWLLPAPASKPELHERVTRMLDGYREEGLVGSVLMEASAYDLRVRDLFNALVQQTRRMTQTHIETGQRAGTVTRGIDGEIAAVWIISMLTRGTVEMVHQATPAPLSRLVTALTDIFWLALYANPL